MDNSEKYLESLIFESKEILELCKRKTRNGSEKATVSDSHSAIGTDDEKDLYDTEDEDFDKSSPNNFEKNSIFEIPPKSVASNKIRT